jgi:hypothetical protein
LNLRVTSCSWCYPKPRQVERKYYLFPGAKSAGDLAAIFATAKLEAVH